MLLPEAVYNANLAEINRTQNELIRAALQHRRPVSINQALKMRAVPAELKRAYRAAVETGERLASRPAAAVWTLADRTKNPREVAEAYAAEMGTTVQPGTVGGQWNYDQFGGDFQTTAESGWYGIRWDGNEWSVTPPESGKCG